MDDVSRDEAYQQLRKLLAAHAKRFKQAERYRNHLGYFSLEYRARGKLTQFAILFSHLRDVRLYFLPLRVHPDLRELLPASVARRIVSKSVFVFKDRVTAGDRSGLAKILAAAARRVLEQPASATAPKKKPAPPRSRSRAPRRARGARSELAPARRS